MNYHGATVHLQQRNPTERAVPVLVSSRGYAAYHRALWLGQRAGGEFVQPHGIARVTVPNRCGLSGGIFPHQLAIVWQPAGVLCSCGLALNGWR